MNSELQNAYENVRKAEDCYRRWNCSKNYQAKLIAEDRLAEENYRAKFVKIEQLRKERRNENT